MNVFLRQLNSRKKIGISSALGVIIIAAYACSSQSSNVYNVASYNFSEDTSCEERLKEQCFSSPEEYAFYIGAEAERTLLQTVEISLETEKEISTQFHESSKYVFVNDNRTRKLDKILEKMLPFVSRKDIDYKIYLIKDEVINAWTIPGGNIYFTTGMLDFIQTDDEIANIIGHEIGHNECKHTHKHLQRSALAKAPFKILGFKFDADFFVNIYSTIVISFGQHEELEADRTGFKLSAKAGYDPELGLEIWKRFAEKEHQNILEKFFRSHPYSEPRYNCGKDYLEQHRN